MDSLQSSLFSGENVNTIVYVSLWLLTIVYIVYQAHLQRWNAIISLVVVFGFFYYSKDYFKLDLPFVLTISLLVSYIATFDVSTGGVKRENFENPDPQAEPEDANVTPSQKEEGDNDSNNDNEEGNMTPPTPVPVKKNTEPKKEEEVEEEPFEDNINIGKTFMAAYKSLTPDQIESMTNDTKELLATQQNLMSTIKSLAPVVIQGKEMLDNFKDYFGADGIKGTMDSLKGTGDVLNSIAPALKSLNTITGGGVVSKEPLADYPYSS